MPIRVIPSFQAPQIATQPVDLAGAFLGPIAAGQAMAQARQRAEQAAVAAQLAEQLAPLKLQQEQLQLQEIQQRINDQAALAPINRLLQQIALREAGVFAPTPARAGVPSALTALPVSAGEQAIIESAPDIFGPRAPQVEQIVSPLERPIVTPEGFVYDPITARAKTIGESTQKIKETELLEEAKARGKARGEADFAAPIKLDKTVTETKVLWTHPNTGEVVKSLDIDPSKKYFNTEGGLRVVGADGKVDFISDPVVAGKGGKGLKPTGEETKSFRMTINVLTNLTDIEKKADEIQKTGKFPGTGQTFINQILAQKPDDIPGAGLIPGAAATYAAIQQNLRKAQTPEARQYEAIRAELTASIIRAQAGLSQTAGEVANVIPYTPQITDSIESLRDKLKNLKRIAERDIGGFQLLYPDFRNIDIPGYTPRSFDETDTSTVRSFNTREEATAAKLPDGTRIIVGGKPGTWRN